MWFVRVCYYRSGKVFLHWGWLYVTIGEVWFSLHWGWLYVTIGVVDFFALGLIVFLYWYVVWLSRYFYYTVMVWHWDLLTSRSPTQGERVWRMNSSWVGDLQVNKSQCHTITILLYDHWFNGKEVSVIVISLVEMLTFCA